GRERLRAGLEVGTRDDCRLLSPPAPGGIRAAAGARRDRSGRGSLRPGRRPSLGAGRDARRGGNGQSSGGVARGTHPRRGCAQPRVVSDTGWLIVALLAGVLFAAGWIKRELWIRRRRAARRDKDARF